MMPDFDPDVGGVAAQPFSLAPGDGDFGKTTKLNIPDHLARYAWAPDRVVDEKPDAYTDKPRNRRVFVAA